jgi:uroporphyrinogen decarboxylase
LGTLAPGRSPSGQLLGLGEGQGHEAGAGHVEAFVHAALGMHTVVAAHHIAVHGVKKMLYQRPDLMHHILETNATAVAAYLNAQIDAGAQAVMLFDSWGGALADGAYQAFSLHYMEKVVRQLKKEKDGVRIPSIVFTKGGGLWLEQIADIGADALGLDWTMNLGRARALVGDRVALQGNLDPAVLLADADQIRAEVAKTLTSFGKPGPGTGHVFNLGHGISQHTNPEAVAVMVDAVHTISRSMRL